MKFNEPFYGLAYADFDRNSACQTLGKGELSVRLELPLKGCGTKQVNYYFINNSFEFKLNDSSDFRNPNEFSRIMLLFDFIPVSKWTAMKL